MKKKSESKSPPRWSKSIPIEKMILILAASFAAYNFGLAGGYIEGKEFSIGGLIAGVVVNVTIAVAASRFGGIKGNKRTRQAVIAFVGMLFLSPMLVSPVIFYSLPETFLGIWQLRALWAIGWPLVADLAIVLAGAVSGKGLIGLSEETATHSAGTASQSNAGATGTAPTTGAVRTNKNRSALALRDECAALSTQYACTQAHCGWVPDVDALIKSAQSGKSARSAAASAKAGHAKNKHPKPIAIDSSLLIGGGEKRL